MAKQRGSYNNYNNQAIQEQLDAQYGKLPPQAPEIEKAVMGALMLEMDAYAKVASILSVETFYLGEHRVIYKVIQELQNENKPVDLKIVTQALVDRELLDMAGGVLYLSDLVARVASAAHIEAHARILAQKFIQREFIRVSSEIQTEAYKDTKDLQDLINFAESGLYGVTETKTSQDASHLQPIVTEAFENILANSKKGDGITGVTTGFASLDKVTLGWQKTDLVILAGRPGTGKTAFILSMAKNMAMRSNVPIVIFSLEMAAIQLVNRLIVSETRIGADKIKTGKLNEKEWIHLKNGVERLGKAPIYIDDTPALSIFDMRSKLRRMKTQYDIQCVFVDYLQLMTVGGDLRFNREQEVSTISRTLKAIAKEIDVPIIALSQLSRGVENREGKRPQLSDLRESGAIEQDADMVGFVHRPSAMGIQGASEEEQREGYSEFIIAKFRNGRPTEVKFIYEGDYMTFVPIDEVSAGSYERHIEAKTPDQGTSEEFGDEDQDIMDEMPTSTLF